MKKNSDELHRMNYLIEQLHEAVAPLIEHAKRTHEGQIALSKYDALYYIVQRLQSLVGGVDVDLDAALSEDDE